MRIFHLIAIAAFSIIALGCGDSSFQGDSSSIISVREVANKKLLWDTTLAGRGYTLEYSVSCYCFGPNKVRVVTDATGAKTRVDLIDRDGNVVRQYLADSPELDNYMNIDDFFSRLSNQWQRSVILNVEFDPGSGMPTSIYSDSYANMADDEVGYSLQLINYF